MRRIIQSVWIVSRYPQDSKVRVYSSCREPAGDAAMNNSRKLVSPCSEGFLNC